MNYANFEDIIFIVNMRIRMMRDTLRLNPPPELFLERSLDDLMFVNSILQTLTRTVTENGGQYHGSNEFDYVSDTEWQFTQLLTEFSIESSPFSAGIFPETQGKIAELRDNSYTRKKLLEESRVPAEIARAEPVVSSAEMNGLLGGF